MTGPIDAITAIHNAARTAIGSFDQAALERARGQTGKEAAFQPLHLFNELIAWHAEGEEESLFPLVDTFAPQMSQDYSSDHKELVKAGQELELALKAGDNLEAARVTAAFKLQLHVHLAKEDSHLYPLLTQRKPEDELYRAVGASLSPIPAKRMPEVVNVLYALTGTNDRERLTRVLQHVLPPKDFAGVSDLIREAVGNDWSELTRRIPELERKPRVSVSREHRHEATSGPA
jgi:hemerythrin-like domain-containing protein